MSKARSMYAGSSGSNYGVNKNSPGNGNGKWQGLWPSVGHARNTRYINTRAGGDNRNVVFCMNQLGGVGRISNMFATTADGVNQPCPGADNSPWWYNNHNIIAALEIVRKFVLNYLNADVSVVFIGDHETLKTDHVLSHTGHDHNDPSWLFEPLHPITSSSEVNSAINLLNSIKIQFNVNGKMQLHVVGIVGNKAAEALTKNGYDLPFHIGDNTVVLAFGDSQPCAVSSPGCLHDNPHHYSGDHINGNLVDPNCNNLGGYYVAATSIIQQPGNDCWFSKSNQCYACTAHPCGLLESFENCRIRILNS